MKNFKQLTKIIFKRNYFWIIMFFLGALLLQNFTIKDRIHYLSDILIENAAKVMYFYDNDPIKKENKNEAEIRVTGDRESGPEDWSLYEKLQVEIQKYKEEAFEKYKKEPLPEDFLVTLNGKFQAVLNKYKITEEDFNNYSEDGEVPWEVYSILSDYYGYSRREINQSEKYKGIKFDISKQIFMPDFAIYSFVIFIAFLLTSFEHLTSFYDFTRMYPWSKEKSFTTKLIIGLLMVLTLYTLSILLRVGVAKTSILKNLVGYDFKNILEVLILFGVYFIAMGTGAVSGNFLGHIGMMIIAMMGLNLYELNISTIENIFFDYSNFSIFGKINNMPAQILFNPIDAFIGRFETYYDFSARLMVFVLGIIFVFLGIYWTKTAKAERSGMLILKNRVSNYAKFFAILTTTNVIAIIIQELIIQNAGFIMIPFYILILFMVYKFYDMLFKIKIKI